MSLFPMAGMPGGRLFYLLARRMPPIALTVIYLLLALGWVLAAVLFAIHAS